MNAARLSQLLFVGLALFFAADTKRYDAAAPSAPPAPKRDLPSAMTQLAKQPLRFEENVGQSKSDARFVARRSGASLYLSDAGATLALSAKDKHAALTLTVDGGRDVKPVASEMLVTKTNYLLGRDKTKWHTNVANYAKVTYPSVLDGVDVVYHGEEGQLEYDFVVAPGADVAHVAMNIGGTAKLALNAKGDLEIGVSGGTLVQPKPRVYQQDAKGIAHDVDASYRLLANRAVGFEVASYDHARPLVIDPIVGYSTYLGGGGSDDGNGIAADSSGNAFIVGTATSEDFTPATIIGPYCTVHPTDYSRCPPNAPTNLTALFMGTFYTTAAINLSWTASAGATSYSIFRATTAGMETLLASPTGTGTTYSDSYNGESDSSIQPETQYFYKVQAVSGGGSSPSSNEASAMTMSAPSSGPSLGTEDLPARGRDVTIAKLSNDGKLVYYTYVGGTYDDYGLGIALDGQNLPVVTGYTQSSDFPSTDGSQLSGNNDAILVQLNAAGDNVAFAIDVGTDQTMCDGDPCPSVDDQGNAVAVIGNVAYVAGAQSPTEQEECVGCSSDPSSGAFVSEVTLGGAITESRLLGGASAYGVAVDAQYVYVVGTTYGGGDPAPTTTGGYQTGTGSSGTTTFLVKLNRGVGLTDVWGTSFYGTSTGESAPQMSASAVALGGSGQAYITGTAQCAWGNTCTFPTRNAFQTAPKGAMDAFIAHFDTTKSGDPSLVYATLLGGTETNGETGNGIAVDALGAAYIVGSTDAADFPTKPATTVPANGSSRPFFAELDPNGGLLNSLVLAGSGADNALGVAVNSTGAYVVGSTQSTNFPVVAAYQSTLNGSQDAFIIKLTTPPLDLEPGSSTAAANGSLVFTATGGAGTGYVFGVSTSGSGGTINPGTGAYTAGANSGTDIITVTDALGNSASARVVVTATAAPPDLVISPTDATVTPRGSLSFTATGGTPPYFFDFSSNASNGTIGNSGFYIAGPRGSVIDTVRVTDQAGVIRTATVRVGAAIAITPNGASVAAGSTTDFRASGGGGAYQWSASAGTITSAGSYTAPNSATAATITVRDTLGNTASVNISVGGAIAITPGDANTYPRGTVHFQAIGGSGSGFKWVLASGASGGMIDVGSGDYTAGSIGNTQDAIEVTDSNGNKASAVVSVGPGLTINPPSATANANGQVGFSAAGGSGAGYVFAMISAPSGGSISQQGVYTAGKNGGNDLVKVTDSAGNTAQAQVTAAAAAQSTSSSGSTSSTSSSGGLTIVVPDVDAGDGSNLNIGVGNANGGDSSCAVSNPGAPASSGGAFTAVMLGLALLRRRQTRRAKTIR